jgi:spermidine synthase
MTPWTLVDRSETPDGTRLELLRRGHYFSIRANGALLMNSRVHGSEEQLAQMALQSLSDRGNAHVLIAGLGCGYTLSAALALLGPAATVSVVEIAPAVVQWNREMLAELNQRALDDPRVRVIEADICDLLRTSQQPVDAILLDVDNGPRAVARASNGWLYSPVGLATLRDRLTSRGVLAIWSAGPEVGFSDRLREKGFEVSLHRVRSHAARTKEQHWIWLATRP